MNGLQIIGASALAVGHGELDNTAQNVANSMTPGYTRRESLLEERQYTYPGGVVLGGVRVAGMRRLADDFVAERVRQASGQDSQAEVFDELAHQLDAITSDPDAGYFEPLEQLQRSLQRASVRPETQAMRQQVLSDAGGAAIHLNRMYQRLMDFHRLIDERLRIGVEELNELSGQVAHLNELIQVLTLAAGDVGPVLDERGRVMLRMAELAGIHVKERGDGQHGMVDVCLPDGNFLVSGVKANQLSSRPDVPDAMVDRLFLGQGVHALPADRLHGILGGLCAFRDQLLLPEQNALGTQAVLLAETSNRILTEGVSLSGAAGAALFGMTQHPAGLKQWVHAGNNTGTASLELALEEGEAALPALVASDYWLKFEDASTVRIVRLSDQAVFAADLASAEDKSVVFDGLRLSMTGAGQAKKGDTFLLTPWRHAAGQIHVILDDPTQLGFARRGAGPGDNRVLTRLLDCMQGADYARHGADYTHSGTGDAPADVAADAPTNAAANAAANAPANAAADIAVRLPADTPLNIPVDVAGKLPAEAPADGEVRLPAGLSLLYQRQVSRIATRARSESSHHTATAAVLLSAQNERDRLAAVNLDEEAANLLRFRQHYQANMKVMAAGMSLLDELLALL